ncbi:TraR/DksA family transcriptional regulator [Hydrogenovibrio sp. 3SP14C1]|uniref:TraR/DksA family transcriptional regulator n=1 Tax=Hydrogenovibrio sp. 3SP14C1 TaxID=3038774 RepID=UPI002417709C|nr:TraR/DksA family transcriptional regulator [Hydrogenovibrio sp. 3SP14C1]MDG4811674.1 TraR/DksA family transcriptional regulator [Hydrogenovibrio sp. 3SP14C1]
MDEIDRAQQLEEMQRQQSLAVIQSRRQGKTLMSVPKYRECEDCGESIPQQRLQLNPTTLRCVDCQTKSERRGKHGY